MAEYINKNDLIKFLESLKHTKQLGTENTFTSITIDTAIKIVENRPTTQIRKRKKGKWLIEDSGKNKYTFCYCSNCKSYYTIDKKDEMNYCPDCGAYMIERED